MEAKSSIQHRQRDDHHLSLWAPVGYAEGDSMADTIMDGEVMLVDCVDREPRSGKIYAILRPDGGVSVKRLIQKSVTGTWTVASDNPDKRRYPDEDASAEVLHDIPIIGRVAWRGGGL